jgi:hypothetical protein
MKQRAAIRVVYRVPGGRLPVGFMNQLQVSLAQTHFATEDQEESLHFAREAAVVDRIAGSVLFAVCRCGGKIIREWAILSLGQEVQEQKTSESPGFATDCIRVMGWAELEGNS